MSLDFSRCRLPPFQHQKEDVQAVIDHPYYFIASEMRTGKSAIIVIAAQFLFEADIIDKVLVVAPAPVRDVWQDKVLGEFAKHLWLDMPAIVTEFHARTRSWHHGPVDAKRKLVVLVTNFEFIRSKNRLTQLLPFCGPKTMLVLDESSFVKNWQAQQTKACVQLRNACGRVCLLNGTPLYHSPLDLFSQGNLLHPSVLSCKYITHFKAKYAVQQSVLGYGGKVLTNAYGHAIQKITGWTNLDDLQRRFAPVTVRRLQADCLDLPPKLDSVTLTATLEPATWKAYKDMRDEMVVWLQQNVATAATAATKVLRLSQITSGFLGGIEDAGIGEEPLDEGLLENIDYGVSGQRRDEGDGSLDGTDPALPEASASESPEPVQQDVRSSTQGVQRSTVQEVGREKLDVLLWFLASRLEADPNLHVVAWCRFRAEMFRTLAAVQEKFPQFEVGSIQGGQKRADRLRSLALLKPETSPTGPVFVCGIEGTGSFGLDMTAAHTCVTMSSGYSPGRNAQTLDRVYGPGQTQPIAYFSIVAVGPKGQRTVDHQIEAARRNGENVAAWTSAAWVKALTEE